MKTPKLITLLLLLIASIKANGQTTAEGTTHTKSLFLMPGYNTFQT